MNEKRIIEIELSEYEELLRDRVTLETIKRYVKEVFSINKDTAKAILGITEQGSRERELDLIPIE